VHVSGVLQASQITQVVPFWSSESLLEVDVMAEVVAERPDAAA
jgi:hypothetical protein